ncbi:MAG: hypothetical protein ACOC6H_03290 [Thermoproteota archaeon]
MKVKPEDLAEAKDLDFEDQTEVWNEYKLEDGSTLKVKLVLQGVKRLDKCNPDGNPIYMIQSKNIVRVVDIPEELKRKPSKEAVKRYRA